jgi:hypothetical protein
VHEACVMPEPDWHELVWMHAVVALAVQLHCGFVPTHEADVCPGSIGHDVACEQFVAPPAQTQSGSAPVHWLCVVVELEGHELVCMHALDCHPHWGFVEVQDPCVTEVPLGQAEACWHEFDPAVQLHWGLVLVQVPWVSKGSVGHPIVCEHELAPAVHWH